MPSLPATHLNRARVPKEPGVFESTFQQRAKSAYVKRPRHATPTWEESTLAKATTIPEGYHSTLMANDWLNTVSKELKPARADHAHNIHQICQALTQYLDHEKGIIRATWATLCATAGVSRATLARALHLLKERNLLGVIASGRSAAKTPRGQEQRNLAPVYTLLLPTPPSTQQASDEDSYYDENGNLFITETPSPLRDRKISYTEAITTGIFDIFCKQRYALYAHRHKDSLEKKRQVLKAEYSSQRQRNQALTHLARTLQHHCFDLRGLSAQAILEVITPFLETGWSVRDVLYALEYSPSNQPYNTRGAAGMRSVKKWLELRMSQWINQNEIMPSRTAIEEQEYRLRQAQRAQQTQAPKKVTGPSIEVKRRIKVALLGESKARHQFPELF